MSRGLRSSPPRIADQPQRDPIDIDLCHSHLGGELRFPIRVDRRRLQILGQDLARRRPTLRANRGQKDEALYPARCAAWARPIVASC
jgi:hypothetical protein